MFRMFDLTTNAITQSMALWCISLYVIALFVVFSRIRIWKYSESNYSKSFIAIAFFIIFAVTYTIDSDFFHYKEIVHDTHTVLDYGLEQFYQYLILFLGNNYFLFRIVVWGIAVISFAITSRVYEIDTRLAVMLLFIMFCGIFSYARASAAFSVYFLGLSLLDIKTRKSSKILYLALAFSLIVGSFFLHRSLALLIILTPLIFLNLNKKTILFFAIFTPVILAILSHYFSDFLALASFDEVMDRRINDTYSEIETSSANWKGIVGQLLYFLSFIVPLYYIWSTLLSGKNIRTVPKSMRQLITYTFVLIYVSLISIVLFEGNTIYMTRYSRMSIVPISILLTFAYKNNFLTQNQLRTVLYVGSVNVLWGFAKFLVI